MSKMLRKTLEPLFIKNKVNFFINGHSHIYERTCAISRYNFNKPRGSCIEDNNYDEWGVTYLTVGSGGMLKNSPIEKNYSWSLSLIKTYGFGKLDVLNMSHALWKFYGSLNNTILDEATIINKI
ncbi:Purple acid phosphatase 19 [Thelohanellus kitauei]|uniref:Purple acid phosphatase 19 n=1 Tax=Thelohanellus kitauei TaxID=669202 RepID=A0A0C2NDQ5_THEKT|nr:Purple acid phosphatase 19 [Thelohanellus kitauei]